MAKADEGLARLLNTANLDESLKTRLLSQPREVAKEFGVELTDVEVQRLTKLGAFRDLATELRKGSVVRCDPRVCYPADVWLRVEAAQLIRYFIRYWVFYPADRFRVPGLEDRISANLGMLHRSVRG
jgi:hypothetical protein